MLRREEAEIWLLNPEEITALEPMADLAFPGGEGTCSPPSAGLNIPSHWVGRQVALRLLLGSYLGIDPGAVRLGRGAGGKPRLADSDKLHFSVSSSGGWWLAVFCGGEVGIDLEIE